MLFVSNAKHTIMINPSVLVHVGVICCHLYDTLYDFTVLPSEKIMTGSAESQIIPVAHKSETS